jgi:hypothetical protein
MVRIITNQKSPKNFKFGRIIYAGILGTVAFNAVMYADIAITGISLDIVAVLGSLAVGESEYAQPIGQAIHLANGVGLSLLFGYVVLPISQKIKKLPVMIYAITFAVIELIIAVWFVMLPMLGAGIAGLDISFEVPLMTLTRHVVFGAVVGFVLRNDVK